MKNLLKKLRSIRWFRWIEHEYIDDRKETWRIKRTWKVLLFLNKIPIFACNYKKKKILKYGGKPLW